MTKQTCKWCKGLVCDGKRKTVKDWNKCPYQRAQWETEISIVYWLLDVLSLGVVKILIFKYKLKKYDKRNKNI